MQNHNFAYKSIIEAGKVIILAEIIFRAWLTSVQCKQSQKSDSYVFLFFVVVRFTSDYCLTLISTK